MKVIGENLDNIKVICDDPSVVIKNNGNNTYVAIIPNKDKEYLFTAINDEDNNYFEGSNSCLVKGIYNKDYVKNDNIINQLKNPPTGDIYSKIFVLIIMLIVGLSVVVLKK